MEARVLELRDEHGWGGRKIRHRLLALGVQAVPSASTVTDILRRNGRISSADSKKHTAWKRFEHEGPNELWQMDFKGHFAIDGGRCHPLTVLDDHSRFSLTLRAHPREDTAGVCKSLTATFERYGLPDAMLVDNGPPWGGAGYDRHGRVAVWLMQLGIGVKYAGVRHPQTIGKDERFHRSLKEELLARHRMPTLDECQRHFDRWQYVYNFERPHEALQMKPPIERYQPSRRTMPRTLPTVEYDHGECVRKVSDGGRINYHGRIHRVGRAFTGQLVALRPTEQDGSIDVYFGRFRIKTLRPQTTADL